MTDLTYQQGQSRNFKHINILKLIFITRGGLFMKLFFKKLLLALCCASSLFTSVAVGNDNTVREIALEYDQDFLQILQNGSIAMIEVVEESVLWITTKTGKVICLSLKEAGKGLLVVTKYAGKEVVKAVMLPIKGILSVATFILVWKVILTFIAAHPTAQAALGGFVTAFFAEVWEVIKLVFYALPGEAQALLGGWYVGVPVAQAAFGGIAKATGSFLSGAAVGAIKIFGSALTGLVGAASLNTLWYFFPVI